MRNVKQNKNKLSKTSLKVKKKEDFLRYMNDGCIQKKDYIVKKIKNDICWKNDILLESI